MGRKPTNRRGLIVTAARRRFTADGYDRTTIGDLASELGISKAAIAYYFPTKDTFLDEFITPFLDDLELAVTGATTAHEAVAGYFRAIIDHHDIAVWADSDATVQNEPRFASRLAEINEELAGHITGTSQETVDLIRVMGVLGGLWRPAREIPLRDLEAHQAEIVDAALASA